MRFSNSAPVPEGFSSVWGRVPGSTVVVVVGATVVFVVDCVVVVSTTFEEVPPQDAKASVTVRVRTMAEMSREGVNRGVIRAPDTEKGNWQSRAPLVVESVAPV